MPVWSGKEKASCSVVSTLVTPYGQALSFHEILQAKILSGLLSLSLYLPGPRELGLHRTPEIFTNWATREAQCGVCRSNPCSFRTHAYQSLNKHLNEINLFGQTNYLESKLSTTIQYRMVPVKHRWSLRLALTDLLSLAL